MCGRSITARPKQMRLETEVLMNCANSIAVISLCGMIVLGAEFLFTRRRPLPLFLFSHLPLLVLFPFLLFSASFTQAEDSTAKEYKVKAAFLLNFARFTTWPDDAGSVVPPIRFCVLGADPLGVALDGLTERKVRERSVTVERLPAPPIDPKRILACHILFVSSPDKLQFRQIEFQISQAPVLTVTDKGQEGIIDLNIVDDMVRFIIDRGKAEKAGLVISSHLLKLAKEVR